jgi:hypothetical protein
MNLLLLATSGGFVALFPLILMIFAFVCFVIAAWSWAQAAPYHGRLVAAGLAAWSLAEIIKMAGGM